MRWHLELNIGFERNEPSLSSIVYRYYLAGLGCTSEEAANWCIRYMDEYERATITKAEGQTQAKPGETP